MESKLTFRKRILPEEFASRMQLISQTKDIEIRHEAADEFMVEVLASLGYTEGCKIFNQMQKYYS